MTVSAAERERAAAARLPADDIVGILLTQHARIRDLFAEVRSERGQHKKHAFDELRALLAVHETSEEMILRPVSRKSAGAQVVEARNAEEDKAARVLAELEKMDVDTPAFDTKFAEFERAVSDHAEREEREEFPAVSKATGGDDLEKLGRRLRVAEKIAPTHPHPGVAGSSAAQWMVGPFASLVDRTKDALRGSGSNGGRSKPSMN